MKTFSQTPCRLILTLALAAAVFAACVTRAATLTNTPSAVSNTYAGIITLQIGGLTNGETVVVEKFYDLNTNGVVDAGDMLGQSFRLTDGQVSTIGGVTNLNVPSDLNASTGAITAQLDFQDTASVDHIIGRYAFRVSSPSGRFTPVTNWFSITNTAHVQSFAGTIRSGGTNVPNAVAVLLDMATDRTFAGGTVANNSGAYSIKAASGTYQLLATKTGYVSDMSTAPVVTLSAGATISTNLNLLSATRTISGRLVDAADTNAGLPGVFVVFQSTNYLLTISFTDSNGQFNVPVTASQWSVSPNAQSLSLLGFVALENYPSFNTTTGNVLGATIALPKGTALIYGSIKDDTNAPLSGITFWINDDADIYDLEPVSNVNGNYMVAVLPGSWWVSPSTDDLNARGYVGGLHSNITVAVNQAVRADFVVQRAAGRVRGLVLDNFGVPLSDIEFGAGEWDQSIFFWQETGLEGEFDFWLPAGQWRFYLSTEAKHAYRVLGPGWPPFVITNWTEVTTNYVVQRAPYYITGHVLDSLGNPVTNLSVYNDTIFEGLSYQGSTWTDTDGNFQLVAFNGSWQVFLYIGEVLSRGYGCGECDKTVTVSNDNVVVNFTVIPPAALQVATTSLPNGQVGTYYWQQLAATGGQPPYHWSLNLSSNGLPPNLSLATNGVLSGIPATNGTFNFSVRVTDTLSTNADQPLSLTIIPAVLEVTTAFLPNATQNAYYSTTLTASGGQLPYSWSLAPGSASLPLSLTLAANGVISGTAAGTGTFPFIVDLTDAMATTKHQLLSLTVISSTNRPVLYLTAPTRLANGQFQFTFNAAAGVNYTIQYSTTLTNWISLLTFGGSDEPVTIVDPNAAGSGQRFYRVRVGP